MKKKHNKRSCPCFRYEQCKGRKLYECIIDCPIYKHYLIHNDNMKLGFEYEKDMRTKNEKVLHINKG